MPSIYFKSILVFTVFFSLLSCEEVVDLPFDVQPRLEISSDLSDERLITYVRYARDINDNNAVKYVDNAVVKVYKGDLFLEELELFQPSGPNDFPCYKSKNLVPEYEVEYTLVVEVENFKTIKAKTSIPKPVNLVGATFDPVSTLGESDMMLVEFDISFGLNDPVSATNFYHLVFKQEMIDFEVAANGDTTRSDPYPHQVQLGVVDANSPVKKYRANDYLFTDELFNGQFLTVNFKGSFEYNYTKQKPGQFTIELRTVSEDYYKKLDSEIRIVKGTNGLEGEGQVIFGNTDNGLGSFTGFTSDRNYFNLSN
jgi:Domain of unknown function (DUF4249)